MEFRKGHPWPGLWIVLEGPDGCGKTRHQRKLADYLAERGYDPLALREPGTTNIGEHIRKALLDPAIGYLDPKTELTLFLSAGIAMFNGVIRPALQSHRVIVQDRWRQSSMAYQGYGGGVDKEIIQKLTTWSTDGARPDLTLMIDIPPHMAVRNKGKITRPLDRIETHGDDYRERVREGYLQMAVEDPIGTKVIPYLEGQFEDMHLFMRRIVDESIAALGKKGLKDTAHKTA